MQVWIVTVVFIFAAFQLFDWAKGAMLPLPIAVLAGAFLAIASNYDRGMALLSGSISQSSDRLSQTATLVESSPELAESNATPPFLEESK